MSESPKTFFTCAKRQITILRKKNISKYENFRKLSHELYVENFQTS